MYVPFTLLDFTQCDRSVDQRDQIAYHVGRCDVVRRVFNAGVRLRSSTLKFDRWLTLESFPAK